MLPSGRAQNPRANVAKEASTPTINDAFGKNSGPKTARRRRSTAKFYCSSTVPTLPARTARQPEGLSFSVTDIGSPCEARDAWAAQRRRTSDHTPAPPGGSCRIYRAWPGFCIRRDRILWSSRCRTIGGCQRGPSDTLFALILSKPLRWRIEKRETAVRGPGFPVAVHPRTGVGGGVDGSPPGQTIQGAVGALALCNGSKRTVRLSMRRAFDTSVAACCTPRFVGSRPGPLPSLQARAWRVSTPCRPTLRTCPTVGTAGETTGLLQFTPSRWLGAPTRRRSMTWARRVARRRC